MGGMQWSGDEEAYFWRVLIPKSPKAIDPDDRTHKWDELAKMMTAQFAPKPRREYNATMLFEHWFQNYVTNKVSPKAAFYVTKYTREVANWVEANPERKNEAVGKKKPHGSTAAARRRAGALRAASASTPASRGGTRPMNTPVTDSPQAVASPAASTSDSPQTSYSAMSTPLRTLGPAGAGRIDDGRFRERSCPPSVLFRRSLSPRFDFSIDRMAQQSTTSDLTEVATWNNQDDAYQGEYLQSPYGQVTSDPAFTPHQSYYTHAPTIAQYRWGKWDLAGLHKSDPEHSYMSLHSFPYQDGGHCMVSQNAGRAERARPDEVGHASMLQAWPSGTTSFQQRPPGIPQHQEEDSAQVGHQEAPWEQSMDRFATLVAAAEQCSTRNVAFPNHPSEPLGAGDREMTPSESTERHSSDASS